MEASSSGSLAGGDHWAWLRTLSKIDHGIRPGAFVHFLCMCVDKLIAHRLATIAHGSFVVGAMACARNPYDGHTLEEQPE